MAAPLSSTKRVRFGVFELDLHNAELRKRGAKVKLQDQSFRLLRVLVEHPAEVVPREELHRQIWPGGTFVEFDQGLYSAVARLRDALGDSAENPCFIETVARRGYRFLAEVTSLPQDASPDTIQPPPNASISPFQPTLLRNVLRDRARLALCMTLALVLVAVFAWVAPHAGVPSSQDGSRVASATLVRNRHPRSANEQANDLYQRGKYALDHRDPDSVKEALVDFQQAVKLDSSFVLPYQGIAAAYGVLGASGAVPRGEAERLEEAALIKALEVDPSSAEAHVDMGMLLLKFHRDTRGAEREWRAAITIDPSLATAHSLLSRILSDSGRLDDALTEARRAEQLEPFSQPMRAGVILILTQLHRFDEATAKAATGNADGSPMYALLGNIYATEGQFGKAAATWERLKPEQAAFFRHALAYAYARTGRPQRARAILNQLLTQRRTSRISPYWIACVYSGLGEPDHAVRFLQQAYQEHDPGLRHLANDYYFDRYRSVPDVAALEKAVATDF